MDAAMDERENGVKGKGRGVNGQAGVIAVKDKDTMCSSLSLIFDPDILSPSRDHPVCQSDSNGEQTLCTI
jgi:hypothetical protein